MGPRGVRKKQKPENLKKSLFQLIGYLKPFRFTILIVVICATISASATIFGPHFLGEMVNEIPKNFKITPSGVQFTPNFAEISRLGLILLGLYIFSAVFGYLQTWLMSAISQKTTFRMREEVSKKIARLPMKYLDNRKVGDVISIVTNDIETIGQNFSQSLSQILSSAILLVGVLIMMIRISWEMSLIAVVTVFVAFILMILISKFSQKYFSSLQGLTGKINAHTEEMISSHEVMKAYNGEKSSVEKFNQINNEVFESAWKSQFFGGLNYPLMGFIGNLSSLTVVVFGGVRVVNGNATIGDITAFMSYIQQFNQPINQLASSMTVIQTTLAASERVFEFLNAKEEKIVKNPIKISEKIKGKVEFSKVNFSYQKDKPVITNFSVKVAPNSQVAIVGPTGAGKTTLVNLLMRFYDIDSGEIKIDGNDISKMTREDVRSMFGMVLQDTWLFSGTIAENIAYSRPDATMDEIVQAAKMAHADHFIRTLPEGYDTKISEDADNISAGEKQLLTIARAFLANPSILILDEATSSVDTRTEFAIQSAMDKLAKNRTSFVIAHRLSTIKNADLILVLEKGNIVEKGTHAELLAKDGAYAKLYNSQFSEEI